MTGTHFFSSLLAKLDRSVEEVVPFFHYIVRRNRKLKEATAKTVESKYESETEEDLRDLLKDERSRSAAIDEKTFKMTLSLTLGLTILGTLSPLLLDRISSQPIRLLCGVMMALAVFYALAGGFVALGAMRTMPVYGTRNEGIPKERSGARRKVFAEALVRNELIAIVKHLRNETSFMALRNGFICLSIALTIFVIGLATQSAALTLPSSLLCAACPSIKVAFEGL